jgi:phosphatidylinositol alpha-1,6-mannosyltransferase
MDLVIANSRATADLASEQRIRPEKIVIIPPGVEITKLDEQARQRFRSTNNLNHRKILLSVGRLTARKGLREFVSQVLPKIVQERPEVILVIVGDAPMDSLHAQIQTPESIMESAQAAGISDNVLFMGKLFGRDLADAYAGADLHVFPVREIPNDPEGFGMVAVEAAAHGLATVAYATGGIVDAVSDGESGRLVKPGDKLGFKQAVLESLADPLPRKMLTTYANQFSWKRFSERLTSALIRPTRPR